MFFGVAAALLLLSGPVIVVLARMLGVGKDDPILVTSYQTALYLAMFGVLAAMLRFSYDAPFWKSLGWVSSRVSWVSALTFGVLLAFGVAILGGILRVQSKDSEIEKLLNSPQGMVIVPLFAVTVAPVCEELIFRGFLQPLLVRSIGVVSGILVTSALFGMLHFEEYGKSWGPAAMIGITGLALGIIRQVSGSTRISALAHMAYNSTLFIALFIANGRTAQH